MQIAYDEKTNLVMLKDVGSRYASLKNMGMKWDKQTQTLRKTATLPFLMSLSTIINLPASLEAEKKRLIKIDRALSTERNREKSVAYIKPPIKAGITPYQHQVKAYNMALIVFDAIKSDRAETDKRGKGFGYLFEMGCGKTLTAIMTVGTLYRQGRVKKLLVVAPTSVCSVWPKEFAEYADFMPMIKVLTGTKQQRLKALDDLHYARADMLQAAVINYESVWREEIFEALQEWSPDMIIADESQRIKTHNAKQSKAMHQLGDSAKYKLILSGTPVQNNAIDLYSQYRFLDPEVFGTNYYAFRNRYAIMGGFDSRQIIGYRDLNDLIKKEYSVAYRVTKEDALDLPEQVHEERYIELTAKERSLYDQIRRNSFAELESGGQITAATALTKLLRLQQLTGGFLCADEGTKPKLISESKLNALDDIIEDYCIGAGKKLVVFARFRAEIDLIAKHLDKRKIRYGLIYGDVKIDTRGDIVKDFQQNPETLVFLAQIDTAGLGITLTAADTCVYYSVNYNYAAYSQSLARIHRIGQRNTCTYIHLIAKQTVDETILDALSRKEDLARTIVDDWKQYFT